jgi:hypothetical protein
LRQSRDAIHQRGEIVARHIVRIEPIKT